MTDGSSEERHEEVRREVSRGYPEASEADAEEQERSWSDEDESEPTRVPLDAPEADVLEQSRESGLDDSDRDHG